jgi:hypothetical protein
MTVDLRCSCHTEGLSHATVSWNLHLIEHRHRPIYLQLKYMVLLYSFGLYKIQNVSTIVIHMTLKYEGICFATNTNTNNFDINFFTTALLSVLNKTVYSTSDKAK